MDCELGTNHKLGLDRELGLNHKLGLDRELNHKLGLDRELNRQLGLDRQLEIDHTITPTTTGIVGAIISNKRGIRLPESSGLSRVV
jgi:hypothetical protein